MVTKYDLVKSKSFIEKAGKGIIQPPDLEKIFVKTAQLLSNEPHKANCLLYPGSPREHEAKQAMSTVLTELGYHHMVERPVKNPITMSALKSNNDIRFYYLKKLLQGKKPMVALGACMHKTLRTLFAMLKNKTIFSSSIKDTEVKDLEEKLEKIKKKPDINILREIEKKRFYQDFDSTAPISAFQHNKRKDYRSYMVNKK